MMPVWKNEVRAGSIQFPPLKAMRLDFDATQKTLKKLLSLQTSWKVSGFPEMS